LRKNLRQRRKFLDRGKDPDPLVTSVAGEIDGLLAVCNGASSRRKCVDGLESWPSLIACPQYYVREQIKTSQSIAAIFQHPYYAAKSSQLRRISSRIAGDRRAPSMKIVNRDLTTLR
jgi:hypothetical protein